MNRPWREKKDNGEVAVAERSGPYATHALALLGNGYSPIRIVPGSKRPPDMNWSALAHTPDTPERIAEKARATPSHGVGVVGGYRGLVPIDIDTEDGAIVDAVCAILPAITVAKKGKNGFAAFFRAPESWEPEGRKFLDERTKIPLVEVLGTGKSILPPTIHPDTGQPYAWLTPATLFDTPIDALPQLIDDFLWALERVLEPWTPKPRPLAMRAVAAPRQPGDARIREYALGALRGCAGELASLSAGRNVALFNSVCAVGSWFHHGHLSEDDIRGELLPAYERCNGIKDHGRRQFFETVKSGLRKSANDPLRVPPTDAQCEPEVRPDITQALIDGEDTKADVGILASADDALEAERAEAFALHIAKTRRLADHDPSFPAHLAQAPGLVGRIQDWIVSTARYPSPVMALPSALLTVGTAMGRTWAGPTESATHLYALLTAPSGVGKDHPLKCVSVLLEAAQMEEMVGPSKFQSATSIVNTITRKALCVTLIDEFSDFLRSIGDPRASPHVREMGAVLRELWSNSFDTYRTPEWAQRQSEAVEAPSLSIFGVTTADEFYSSLTERVVGNGLLNRFFVVHQEDKPPEGEPLVSRRAPPPPVILDGLSRLRMPEGIAHPITTVPGMRHNAIKPRIVPWGHGAEAIYRAMRASVDAMSEEIGRNRVFFARTCEMALRVATIAAGGCNPQSPVLTADLMIWARDLMLWSHRDMMEKTQNHIAETQNAADVKRVYRVIKASKEAITRSQLINALDHAISGRTRDEALKELIDSGKVMAVTVKTKGRPSTKYRARG